MGVAHNGDDDIAFFAADLGETRELSATTTGAQTTDTDGALEPGRYLIQIVDATAGAIVWIIRGRFERGAPLSLSAGPGPARIPLSTQALVAIETHVREGDSDRIGAITNTGVATVYLTRVSTGA
jgi:hypothetical protein